MKSLFVKLAIAVIVAASAAWAVAYNMGYEKGNTAGLKLGFETGWKAHSLKTFTLSDSQKTNPEQPPKAPDGIGHTGNGPFLDVRLGSSGAINTQTGEFYPSALDGVINPQTGTYYHDVGLGYVDTRTGRLILKNPY